MLLSQYFRQTILIIILYYIHIIVCSVNMHIGCKKKMQDLTINSNRYFARVYCAFEFIARSFWHLLATFVFVSLFELELLLCKIGWLAKALEKEGQKVKNCYLSFILNFFFTSERLIHQSFNFIYFLCLSDNCIYSRFWWILALNQYMSMQKTTKTLFRQTSHFMIIKLFAKSICPF